VQVLGPDVSEFEYVAWQCDQDAYAYSGQKCSAQSILFAHDNWVAKGLLDKLKVGGWEWEASGTVGGCMRGCMRGWVGGMTASSAVGPCLNSLPMAVLLLCDIALLLSSIGQGLAGRRKLEDLTVGPVLTVTNKRYLDHINALLKIKGVQGPTHETHTHLDACIMSKHALCGP
jgi:hypothetical protein